MKEQMKDALEKLKKGFEALQMAVEDSQAEKAEPTEETEPETEQEKRRILADALRIGTTKVNGKQWIIISMESEDASVKLIHPMKEEWARSAAQSLLSLADELKEE